MSNAKKATAKKVVKKATARTTTAAPRQRPPRVVDEDGADVPLDVPEPEDAPAEAEVHTIDLALSSNGTRTGEVHPLRVRRPTDTQIVWFEAAAHRFDLAMEAWKEGVELAAGERGEVYSDALNAMNVFVATRYDRAWVSQAMASGVLELDAVIEGINLAKDALGLAEGSEGGADIVVA